MKKMQELEGEKLLFTKLAWQLYNNRETIMSDPRMAYAPIEMENILAYVGEAFKQTSIGTYLEWWHTNEKAVPFNKQGLPTLVVRFIGSPLSGQNKCQVVTTDGSIEEWRCPHFGSLWKSFFLTNKKFKCNRPDNLQPYTLEQVIKLLFS